ncbi:transient receptor potential cation channel subfamily A member 1 homolog isoform X2 [Penaeus vannamei]|uniref:transient receptor potential cation channel subfamily A member 1 homolog isoform X2 n=1 Tax=Penaeus vannamei TaxID=6689 RepID=UPI00387F9A30
MGAKASTIEADVEEKEPFTDDPEVVESDGFARSRSCRVSMLSESLRVQSDLSHSIHQLAEMGNTEVIQLKVQNQENVDLLNSDQLAPLHYATRYNQVNTVKLLLENGAEVNVKGLDDLTPLHFAARMKPRQTKAKPESPPLEDSQVESGTQPDAPQASTPTTPTTPSESTEESMVRLLAKHGALLDAQDKYGQTPLHFASMTGNLAAARDLIRCGAVVEIEDNQQMTPIIVAATYGYTDIVRLLLIQAKANIRQADSSKQNALHRAAKGGHLEIVKMMIQTAKTMKNFQSFLDARDAKKKTSLYHAASNGHAEVVASLLAEGADVDADNVTLATPLHAAASVGNVLVISMLLEYNAQLDATDLYQRTPLMYSAGGDHTEAIATLVSRGASMDARDLNRSTPLLIAAQSGHAAAVQALLDLGANERAMDKLDKTALYLSAEHGKLEALQVLTESERGRDLLNFPDCYGRPPLHVAVSCGNMAVLEMLLKAGAEVYKKNEEQDTILHLAARKGYTGIVRELVVECRSMLDAENEDLDTPLHLACKFGHEEVVKVLLESGSDVGDTNAACATPLHLAAEKGHAECCRMLLQHGAHIDSFNKDNKTPLLLAVLGSHVGVTRLLLDHGASLRSRDATEMNALEIAIENGLRDVVLSILRSPAWEEGLRKVYEDQDGHRSTPFRKLVEKMPEVAEEVLDRCIKTSKASLDPKETQEEVNFEFLDDTYQLRTGPSQFDSRGRLVSHARPYTTNARELTNNHPLMLMVVYLRTNLLAHPVCVHLIKQKWYNYGRFVYYGNLFLYLTFVTCLTGYVISVRDLNWVTGGNMTDLLIDASRCPEVDWESDFRLTLLKVCKGIIIALAVVEMLKEVSQIYQALLAYLTFENLLEWICYVTAVVFVMDFADCPIKQDWQWQVGATSIFLAWINFLLFIRVFPFFGIYVIMFTEVFTTFSSFFVVFFLFIIAFALGFYTVLGTQYVFRSPSHSLLRTFVMMIGEINFVEVFSNNDDPLEYPEVTYALVIAFLVIMSILIMNLLVGLAVDDIKAVQEQAMLQKLAMQTKLLMEVEMVIPDRVRRKYVVSKLQVSGTRRSLLSWVLGKITLSEAKEVDEMETLRREVLNLNSAMSDLGEVKAMLSEMADLKSAVKDVAELKAQVAEVLNHLHPQTRRTKSIFRIF